MKTNGYRHFLTVAVLAGGIGGLVGCVQRTIKITSNPSGALVHLNDEEVGRTPVVVPFTFYGTYDVRLKLDGYKTKWTSHRAKAPWWEAPGPDIFAELLTNNKVRLAWEFDLEPATEVTDEDVLQRARQMQEQTASQVP